MMSNKTLLQKGIIFAVIILFFGTSVTATLVGDAVEKVPSFTTCYSIATTQKIINKGTLSGYVNDSSMNPIKGARVRVHFHGTYEENYSDSSGYYTVDNIPICYCLKNCTAHKKGYKTTWTLLAVDENTIHDFVLAKNKPVLLDLKNQQIIKYFYLLFLERCSLLERLLLLL